MWLLEGFLRNPVKTAVGVLLVALFGGIALLRMPIQLTPEVDVPTITVETRWPGASPQEIEQQIITEQEEQLKGVEGMIKMTSESYDSAGSITLEFAVGTDMSEALVKVSTRLNQVPEYPEAADEPVVSTTNITDRSIAWFILRPLVADVAAVTRFQDEHPELREALEPVRRAAGPGLRSKRLLDLVAARPELREALEPLLPARVDVPGLRRFTEDFIEARFERVPGVANANVLGGREDELQVLVDPQRLAARRLTIMDLRRALEGQNVDTSGGDLWDGKRRWTIRTLGQFKSPDEVLDTIVASPDGKPVYVRDVAEVRLGYKKPDGMVRNFGTEAIAINAQRALGANVLDTMAGLQEACAELNESILKRRGLYLEQVYDETEYINSSVGMVQDNILVGGGLTVLTLLVFLRNARSTLVVALAIPTSIIGTFLVLHLLGRSLNVVSLAGMAFAVGMLVDNAIVVLENIFRRYQLGEDAPTAATRGTYEVWGAVLSSTATTLAVFLPVIFVQEEAGQLFRDIALAISAAVALSLAVSVTVIPVAASRLLRRSETVGHRASLRALAGTSEGEPDGPDARWGLARLLGFVLGPADALGGAFLGGIVGLNAWLMGSAWRRLVFVATVVGVSTGLSYLLLPKVEYLPQGNRNLVIAFLLPPPGYNLDRLTEIGEQIETDLRPYWDVDPDSPEALVENRPIIADFFYVARGKRVFMGLRSHDPLRAGELVPVLQQVLMRVPGTFGLAKQSSLFERGLTAGRTVEIEITGPSLERLVALGQQVFGQVQTVVPGAQSIPEPSLDLASPELHVRPRWQQAADMAFTAAELGYTVDALVDGARAGDYYLGGDKIDLSIVGLNELARRTQDVAGLPVATPAGQIVPLAALADVRIDSGPEQINHRNRQRAVTITVSPPAEMALEDALERIQTQIVAPLVEGDALEGGYQIRLAGTADKLRAAWSALWFNLLLAFVITYLLMAGLFESWLYPFVVILSVPLGAVGGILALRWLNLFVLQPLDVLTMLGFVILIGTVVNNPILIVEQTLNHIRFDAMTTRAAILESVRNRVRPISMTTLTTLLGLLPLVLVPGAGSELYRGLGAVLLGGLAVSTLFTLVLTPTLFSLTMETWEALTGRRLAHDVARTDAPVASVPPATTVAPVETAAAAAVPAAATVPPPTIEAAPASVPLSDPVDAPPPMAAQVVGFAAAASAPALASPAAPLAPQPPASPPPPAVSPPAVAPHAAESPAPPADGDGHALPPGLDLDPLRIEPAELAVEGPLALPPLDPEANWPGLEPLDTNGDGAAEPDEDIPAPGNPGWPR